MISTSYSNQTLGTGRTVEYDIAATDADSGDTLQYKVAVNNNSGPSVTVSPTDLTNLEASSKVTVTTGSTAHATAATVTVTVTDGTDEVTLTFDVTVQADATPSFGTNTQDDLSYTKDEAITTVTLPEATGGNGTITYALTPDLSAGLAIDSGTRELTGTPTAAAASAEYTWKATDSDGSAAELTFNLEVTEPTREIVLSETSRTLFENGGAAEFTVGLSTAPSDDVTITVTPSDTGAAKVCEKTGNTACTAGNSVTLTMTSTSYTSKTITLTGQNDDIDNAGNKRDITIDLATGTGNSDSNYNSKTASVAVVVVDDDVTAPGNAIWAATLVAGESSGVIGFKSGDGGTTCSRPSPTST